MTRRILTSPVTHAVLFAAFIFYLSSVTSPPVLGPLNLNDKIKHVLLYSAFAVMVSRGVAARECRPWRIALWTIVLVGLYGATDEFHQRFTPGRSCDVLDWVADVSGAVLVSLTLPFWVRRDED